MRSIASSNIMATYKMVRLTPQAYEILTSVGRKNESYSDVVIRLAGYYKKTGGNK
ncbi:MAG: hypothetical protein JO297_03870 [Nitrososphaeraceae archaeon]|nr:hypothetical protein [Nitrososphaeraceae archaeon]